MKNILIIIALASLLYSCKKSSSTGSANKITGKMVLCSNGVENPYLTNTVIDLFQQNYGSNNNSKVLASTTIDAQGNFSFSYNTSNGLDKLTIRETGGYGFNPVITGLPIQDIANLKVFYSARYNLVVNLNATKPYSNLDTLKVLKGDSTITLKRPGPFTNRRLFKINSFTVSPEMKFEKNIETIKASLNNTINLDKEFVVENSKLCGDTVYVNVDVR